MHTLNWGERATWFPISQIINLPISSGKMRALRPIHTAEFFARFHISSGKMWALRPVHAAQFLLYCIFQIFSHRLWMPLFVYFFKKLKFLAVKSIPSQVGHLHPSARNFNFKEKWLVGLITLGYKLC